ncbi:MAG: glycosyltransferase [Endomicrobium sp.]|jgi:ADP-heptose:LPS heptosyltransferase|nr:glycosyltransferase [Endomicrobium sp.]
MLSQPQDIEVFIATYNRCSYLRQAVGSIKKQTVKDFKITVLDNASSDATSETVKEFDGINYIKASKNEGGHANFLKAQNLASAKYTMFFHDDDILHPQYVERVLAAINAFNNPVFISSCFTWFKENNVPDFNSLGCLSNEYIEIKKDYEFASTLIAPKYSSCICSFVYRADLFKKIKPDFNSYGKINDWPYALWLAKQGNCAVIADNNAVFCREHANRDTVNPDTGLTCRQLYNWCSLFYKTMSVDKNARKLYLLQMPKAIKHQYKVFVSKSEKQKMPFKNFVEELRRNDLLTAMAAKFALRGESILNKFLTFHIKIMFFLTQMKFITVKVSKNKILLFKFDGIGDFLFLRMFFKQLKSAFEKKNISADFLCAKNYKEAFAENDKYVFKNVYFESARNFLFGFVKRKTQLLFFIPRYMKRLAADSKNRHLTEQKFAVLMNMQTKHNTNIGLFNRLKAGRKYISAIDFNDKPDAYYDRIVNVNLNDFILEHYKKLLSDYFETPFSLPDLQLPFSKEQALETAKKIMGCADYACFVPFTTSRARNWNPENFVYIARRICESSGKKIAVLGKGNAKTLKKCFNGVKNVVNLFNKTSLKEAMRIAAASKYCLTADTSLMHCAVIGGANCICISCGNDNKLFVEYPKFYNVKQTILYPENFDSSAGVHHSKLDINSISKEKVWDTVKTIWKI